MPSLDSLEEGFRGRLGPSLRFREIGHGVIGFRQTLLEVRLFNYLPMIHGLVWIDSSSRQAQVEGRTDWWPAVAVAYAGVFLLKRPDMWPILVFMTSVFIIVYLIQARLFRAVGKFIAEKAP